MSKIADSYDTLAVRLTEILKRLNAGKQFTAAELATEFNVDPRTIQRDLKVRLGFLPLKKSGTRYSLDLAYLGKLTEKDLRRFAELAGVRELFSTFSNDFLFELFDARVQSALMVKGYHYEDLSGKEPQFRQLEQAIKGHQFISFSYHKDGGTKAYAQAKPYKLVNHGGIWYLAAQDGDTLKAFSFGKIDRLLVLGDTFGPDPSVQHTLQAEDGIWLNPDKKEVVLKVSREAASYFTRRNLIAHQVIEKTLEDGGLIVSGRVAHHNQILPIVRYWLPNVRIISPEGLQAEMESQMRDYLSQT
jgi:predicted DNA-binding transcriptional regulator YafY